MKKELLTMTAMRWLMILACLLAINFFADLDKSTSNSLFLQFCFVLSWVTYRYYKKDDRELFYLFTDGVLLALLIQLVFRNYIHQYLKSINSTNTVFVNYIYEIVIFVFTVVLISKSHAIKSLVLFIIFLMPPFSNAAFSGFISSIPGYFSIAAIGVYTLMPGNREYSENLIVKRNNFILFLLILILGIVHLFIGQSRTETLNEFFRLFLVMIFFLRISDLFDQKEKLTQIISIILALNVVLAIWYTRLAFLYPDLPFHGGLNSNTAATLFEFSLAFSIWNMVNSRSTKARMLFALYALIFILSIFFSNSRSGMIATIIGIVFALLYYKFSHNRLIVRLLSYFVILCLVVVHLAIVYIVNDTGITIRLELWQLSFAAWSKKAASMLFGTGLSSSFFLFQNHVDGLTHVEKNIHLYYEWILTTHPHNSYVIVLFFSGIYGILLLVFAFYTFGSYFKSINKRQFIPMMMCLIILLIHASTEPVFPDCSTFIFTIIPLSIISSFAYQSKKMSFKISRTIRNSMLMLLVAGLVFTGYFEQKRIQAVYKAFVLLQKIQAEQITKNRPGKFYETYEKLINIHRVFPWSGSLNDVLGSLDIIKAHMENKKIDLNDNYYCKGFQYEKKILHLIYLSRHLDPKNPVPDQVCGLSYVDFNRLIATMDPYGYYGKYGMHPLLNISLLYD